MRILQESVKVVNKTETEHHSAPFGLRTVAVFEFVKGLLVLLVGVGVLSLIHRDVQFEAERIVEWLHFNPARHYPAVFIELASRLTDQRLWLLAGGAMLYAIIRFVETYGLWHARPWAEWFAVISAGLYLPIEVVHAYNKKSLIGTGVFLLNLAIVLYLGRLLLLNHRRRLEQMRQKQAADA
ncbi:MAG: uncharacterized protein JWR19_4069 [Pedosphaera sp.]|nr:uncharacterized protein [Pedosphaera sp.]